MKRSKIILAVLILSIIVLVFSGCGGSVIPPIDNDDDSDSGEIELIEVVSKEINLNEGGVVEVTDPESELYGLKLTIEPQKNIRKDKGLPVTISIYLALVGTCKLPDFQGFLITPFIIMSDFADTLFGKLEIPYCEEQLKNSGVAINAPVKVCRVFSPPLPWVELSSDKYTVSNNIANISIGIEVFNYYYTLTVNNAVPPNSSGFKSPQPGDLLYKFSKFPPLLNINEGWCSGHVGIYVGEKYDEEEEKPYNVIEALLGGVTRSYHSPISEFGDNSIYLGAREPKSGLLQEQRNKIVAFAENAVGTPYSLIDTVSTMVFSGLGRGNLVKGYGNDFNCVGLAEAAYEYAGVDLVSNYDEGNEIYGPCHILTPAEQWFNTVPATGNHSPVISSLTANPSSVDIDESTSITCIASDEDVGDTLTYAWSKSGGTITGSGSAITWTAPSTEGTYAIACTVSDENGVEDRKSVYIVVDESEEQLSSTVAPTISGGTDVDDGYVNADDFICGFTSCGLVFYGNGPGNAEIKIYINDICVDTCDALPQGFWTGFITNTELGADGVKTVYATATEDGLAESTHSNEITFILDTTGSEEDDTYTISASAGSHGSISPSGSIIVNQGSDKSFTITPDTGYQIDDVRVDGSSVGAVSSYTFTNVTQDHTIYATFIIESSGTYDLRDIGPAGGWIFYDKGYYSDGWRYLEAAPASTEWTGKQWGSYGTLIGGTETDIGTGQSNTTKIVTWLNSHSEANRAAQLCNDLTEGGYSDWFLPSKDELNKIYKNLKVYGVGGFARSYYWGSSEDDADFAWSQDFYDGGQGESFKFSYFGFWVRAVRAF